jgi:hypothetical protein
MSNMASAHPAAADASASRVAGCATADIMSGGPQFSMTIGRLTARRGEVIAGPVGHGARDRHTGAPIDNRLG